MLLTNLRAYLKFLGRNKVYTTVTIAGFGVSLMFVIVLGLFVKQELSVDSFHEKRERIFLMASDLNGGVAASFANPVGPWVVDNYPEAESFVRVMGDVGEITRPNGEIVTVNMLFADSTFFNIFSFPLAEGDPSRVLERRNAAAVSRSYAAFMFPGIEPVGKLLEIGDQTFEVTGVFEDFPRNTQFPRPDVVANYQMLGPFWGEGANFLTNWGRSDFQVYLLEREGADLPSKAADIADRFKGGVNWIYEDGLMKTVEFVPLKDVYFRDFSYAGAIRTNSLTQVMLYLGIALVILVVALLNYINMTVAQAGFRGKEVALKKLHGAGRGMIVSQLLVESLVMTLISFGVGLVLAFAAEPFFDEVLGTTLGLGTAFTLPVVAAIVGLIAVLAVVSGIVPAMLMSRFKPIEIIKGSFSRRVKGVYSRVLAVFQYAVSIALLICSAIIIMQSRYLATRDVGLQRDGIMLINAENNVGDDTGKHSAVRNLLGNIPGVEAVSLMVRNPFNSWGGNWSGTYNDAPVSFEQFRVDSVFFRMFGVEVEPTGIDRGAENFIYLNRAGWNAFQPEATDYVVRYSGSTLNIGGLVSDFNFRSSHTLPNPIMLRVTDDINVGLIAVKIAAGSDFISTSERVRSQYAAFIGTDRFEWEWADDTVYEFYEAERRTSRIMGAFTVLVMLIMLMGIFAMSIYVLRQKEKEIAIRKVHGSTIGEILALLGWQSLVSVAFAFAVACPVAWWASTRWLEDFPYRIAIAWWVFAAAGASVLILTFVCVGWQSYRAASANPVKTLKSE